MSTTATMTGTIRDNTSTRTLLAALALGVAGDLLFWEVGPFGPTLSIWVALLGVATFVLNRHAEPAWRKALVLWSCVAFAATLVLTFRAAEELISLTLLVLLLCSSTVLLQARGTHLLAARVVDYFRSGFQMPVQVLLGIIPLLGKVPLHDASISARTRGIVRGLMMVTPLLLVFVGLFSAADSTFERYASRLGDVLSLDTPQHILVVLIISWIATGLLTCTFRREGEEDSSRARLAPTSEILPVGAGPARNAFLPHWAIGDEETGVIMGSLVALFLAFVILQATYLFGGSEMIERTSGLTVAGYARRGFFELLAVSVLTLAVLLMISASQCNQRIFRPLALVLIACVLLILVSAAQRLSLYTDAFGLTMSRVLAVAFMVWLAGNLISFAATVLRGRRDGFASGLVLSGIVAIILLGTANPAAVVARVNVERMMQEGVSLDIPYLSSLGADAVPVLMEHFDALSESDQCQVAFDFYNRWHPEGNMNADKRSQNWRTWNVSKARARSLVIEREETFRQITKAC
ncbi:MAG: DUF4173 domain-containing protein [Gammaproteobacteria bacterium]|nr:DUF4173 domain-containing protein [Gammaproteobacteria bacterium]MDP2142202.1 DUF4173 domain-containing protein [Gammaproteobacteria bacterium]MDP2348290.1 DUF4173 domain-containing protein [Gammaproteobacteria bacterium]